MENFGRSAFDLVPAGLGLGTLSGLARMAMKVPGVLVEKGPSKEQKESASEDYITTSYQETSEVYERAMPVNPGKHSSRHEARHTAGDGEFVKMR